MGQKVNPHGLRVGIVKDWDAKWYADKDFAANLHEDVKIRNFLKETLFIAGISRIEIERTNKRIKLTIHTAKPGMVTRSWWCWYRRYQKSNDSFH